MAMLGPFEAEPTVAVGVSGGRDSLTLALLTRDWVRQQGGRILALIVDHRMRADSTDEAAATAALLDQQGIAAERLTWTGDKPSGGLQAAARAARYRLLFEACRRHGILHLAVAHHADDQAETVAMRAARDSGPDGLAGMAALVEHREARLLRPLLSVPRARLTATLEARGVRWIEDPSNHDLRFERARLRLAAGPAPTVMALPAVPVEAGLARAEREARLAALAVEMLEIEPAAGIAFDQAAFVQLGAEQGARFLGGVVQAVGRRPYLPRRDRLDRAVARLMQASYRGKSGKSQDFTLSECRLMLRQEPSDRRLRWIVRAENGRKEPQIACRPLAPPAFFACGAERAPHLHSEPLSTDQNREPVQS
jgi:tRNA(Ile)-lysidine synthase